MHSSAATIGKLIFKHYLHSPDQVIVEIGSQLVNGGLRNFAPDANRYIGLDFEPGAGVDLILEDPYQFPLADGSADLVVSSSVFEHAEFFWLSLLEALRILKDGGVLYLNAPSTGYFHRYPQDCWRFYPDAANALCRWGRKNGYEVSILETFTAKMEGGILLNDWVLVLGKGPCTVRPKIAELVPAYNIGLLENGLVQKYAQLEEAHQVEKFALSLSKGRGAIQKFFPTKPQLKRHDLSEEDIDFLFNYFAHMEMILRDKEF